jgi:predicted dehydrogenase
MYKCAIIGVGGPRAGGLAAAYAHVKRGTLAAVSTRRAEPLEEFGERFGVQARYRDYREMLDKEKPDLVHVNTPPDVRLEVFQAAQKAGVAAVLVEKPVAVQGEDFVELIRFARQAGPRIGVNHQLHYHPRRLQLQERVAAGAIGELLFIEASAGMNLAYQGTHMLQAISAFNPRGVPASVFGQVAGDDGLGDSPGRHYAPDHCIASILYDNGVRAQLACGAHAPQVGSDGIHTHKRVAVHGTRGFAHWTMGSWQLGTPDGVEGGRHDYAAEDILGQASLTESMFDWIEGGDEFDHPLNLENALMEFNVILGLYISALTQEAVPLPVSPSPDMVELLRWRLGGSEHGQGGMGL